MAMRVIASCGVRGKVSHSLIHFAATSVRFRIWRFRLASQERFRQSSVRDGAPWQKGAAEFQRRSDGTRRNDMRHYIVFYLRERKDGLSGGTQ
jgi:hypothetical protein